ncbi:MAG: DUF1295 domain-containing protein, partial [Bacteroidota bacterium]
LVLFPIQYGWITAPYGRHSNRNWGWLMDNRLGWVLMESVSLFLFSYFFFTGTALKTAPMYFLFALWGMHYLNRSFIYPFRTKTTGKKIPVLIVVFAIVFNGVNGWSNGYALGTIATPYPSTWWWSPSFIIGFALFAAGAFVNIQADNYLLSLRKPGEKGYVLPEKGLFQYISCPNHFGEIVEWLGFAIMTWNLAALAFAIWTAANLIPRAKSHHQWYQTHFANYPKNRKAVIPYLL